MTVENEAGSQEPSEIPSKPLFSLEERRDIVSSFCKAYLGGKLEVLAFVPGLVIDLVTKKKTPSQDVLRGKSTFLEFVSIACGLRKGTQQEVDFAIDTIFAWIVSWRGGGLLKGDFLSVIDHDAKLILLEKRLGDLEKLTLTLIDEVRALAHIRGAT